jgi:nucleotide-binding universal stress UspA family protein
MEIYRKEPTYQISYRYRRILVPIDGSETSMMALEFALDMAIRYGSKVTVVHAYCEGDEQAFNEVRGKVKERASKYNANVDVKPLIYDPLSSSAASVIVKEALEGGYDAVVMGARGKSSNEDLLLGSVALAVVMHVPSTIILVR